MTTTEARPPVAAGRPLWRTVAVPAEHGGWGLTLEPVLLGLVVARSWAGAALGAAAFLAFLVRTPLKLALVDARRERWLARSRLAARVAVGELVLVAALVGLAVRWSGWAWVVPVALAAPLVAVELWFDVRSRGRRLLPELCGSVGIAAVAAAVVVAGGRSAALAAGVWLVLAARAVGAIPFVRVQIFRLRRGLETTRSSDVAQVASVAIGVAATVTEHRVASGLAGLVALAGVQLWWARRPPVPARTLGLRQMALGLALVAATAAGVLLT